jgi:acylphosphatase
MRQQITLHGNLTDGGVKYVAQRYAMEQHLTGVSKKGPDGTIVIEVQGNPEKIDAFVDKIAQGNQFFKVDRVDRTEIPEVAEKMFRVG